MLFVMLQLFRYSNLGISWVQFYVLLLPQKTYSLKMYKHIKKLHIIMYLSQKSYLGRRFLVNTDASVKYSVNFGFQKRFTKQK